MNGPKCPYCGREVDYHGLWIWDTRTGEYRCSRCGEKAPLLNDGGDEYIYKPNFCSNCGADMRVEETIKK